MLQYYCINDYFTTTANTSTTDTFISLIPVFANSSATTAITSNLITTFANNTGTTAITWSEPQTLQGPPGPDSEVARRIAKATSATQRAKELFLSRLTAEQQRTHDLHGYVIVEAKRSRNRYAIHTGRGYQGNVVQLDERGQGIAQLCAHGTYEVPMPVFDHFLTQMLGILSDDEGFLKVANRNPVQDPRVIYDSA